MKLISCSNHCTLEDEKCYSENSYYLSGLEPKYVFEENQVQVTWKTEKGIRFPYVSGTLVHPKAYVERPTTHILMNTSEIDAKWCFPILRKYIHATDRVCVFAFSFFDDTKNSSDWNKQYAPGQGIWYRANTDVFFKYGIKKEQIVWVNYFQDSRQEIESKILNSSILLITGGAPDLMMKRIKEFRLKKLLKNYKGLMLGYSAGAMIQLDQYHITPDQDYLTFGYYSGLATLSGFSIEPHYQNSSNQKASIEQVLADKKHPVYAIGELGGLIVQDGNITCFGDVELFESC